jgi:hypothetical protein
MMHLIEGDAKRPTFGVATVQGAAECDGKGLKSLLLVFSGALRHGSPDSAPNQVGAVAEWRAAGP